MYLKRCLLSIILALCLAGICDAIRCYECQSTIDSEHCGEKFSESSNIKKVDCDTRSFAQITADRIQKPNKCSKAIIQDQSGKTIIRGCHFQLLNSNSNCPIEGISGHSATVCETCSSDFCNGVDSKPLAALGTILLVATSILFML